MMSNTKKIFSFSNVSTALLVLFALAMIVSPEAKGWVLGQILKTGILKPNVPEEIRDNKEQKKRTSALTNEAVFADAKGNTVRLSAQKGKVVFLNFWATWCPPCIAEMPSVKEMYMHYKDNPKVVVLPVDVDGNFRKSVAFMDKKDYQLPVYRLQSELPDGFLNGAVPTTIILDKNGNVAFRHEGAADYTDKRFYEFMDKLIKE